MKRRHTCPRRQAPRGCHHHRLTQQQRLEATPGEGHTAQPTAHPYLLLSISTRRPLTERGRLLSLPVVRKTTIPTLKKRKEKRGRRQAQQAKPTCTSSEGLERGGTEVRPRRWLPPHHPQRPLTSMRPPRGLPVGGRVPRRRRRGVSIVRRRPEGGLPGRRRRAEERRAEGRRVPAEGAHLGQAGPEASPAASRSSAARLHPPHAPPASALRVTSGARRAFIGEARRGAWPQPEWAWLTQSGRGLAASGRGVAGARARPRPPGGRHAPAAARSPAGPGGGLRPR